MFFYTWWFAWAPFVSLFIARISYGRSIKEFIIGVLFVPSLIVLLWMGIFGNAGIYQVINETSQLNEIVNNNNDLVYGGARIGLMGILADTVLAEGGKVFGVFPSNLAELEIAHGGLSELFLCEDMHARK